MSDSVDFRCFELYVVGYSVVANFLLFFRGTTRSLRSRYSVVVHYVYEDLHFPG